MPRSATSGLPLSNARPVVCFGDNQGIDSDCYGKCSQLNAAPMPFIREQHQLDAQPSSRAHRHVGPRVSLSTTPCWTVCLPLFARTRTDVVISCGWGPLIAEGGPRRPFRGSSPNAASGDLWKGRWVCFLVGYKPVEVMSATIMYHVPVGMKLPPFSARGPVRL